MTIRFHHTVTSSETELRLIDDSRIIPVDLWATEAPAAFIAGVDLIHRLIASGNAIAEGDVALVEHKAIADLTAREAQLLGLPPAADVRAVVAGRGILTRPDFAATLTWQRPTGQPVVDPLRTGAWLRIGGSLRRLPDVLYRIAEAVDGINAVSTDDEGGRLTAIAALREILPRGEADGQAESRGLLGTITIAQADAFSLDWVGEGDSGRLIPVLQRAGDDGPTPVLSTDLQRTFGVESFYRFAGARSMYTLGGGVFAVMTPTLRRALGEVRRIASAPLATRKAFLASPRAFLRAALGDDVETTVLESVFQETETWSERVVGLGLWQPRIVPWIAIPGSDWFGPETATGQSFQPAPQQGLNVDGRGVPLTDEDARALQARVEDAIGAGQPHVPLLVDGETVAIPATHDTLAALQRLEAERVRPQPSTRDPKGIPEVLLIRPNEQAVEAEAEVQVRPSPLRAAPRCMRTPMKPHQAMGLEWLQRAWSCGLPGVLLADDMGLGKTLQGLAFLAWLREGMVAGTVKSAPLLIVAPTGLLDNWRAEHDKHLAEPGLGGCVLAYGKTLGALRVVGPDDRPGIDSARLRDADWVLTTFETLRDYDKDFGRVRFAAVLFDEAQKIKTPGVRLTDAAKAMNAEFRIAMTGTPVENRLADLWCIVDTVHPACLGDLRSFSAQYERSASIDDLRRLKDNIARPFGGRPPLLLRRLKEDELPDLPKRTEAIVEEPMGGNQLSAYESTIALARNAERRGAVLEALQALRSLCLHPHGDSADGDEAFIAESARLRAGFSALDRVAAAGERALIFLDDLDVQARLVGIIQRRYRLAMPPMVINGLVAGALRQARVDRFQSGPEGFDVMLLSPRAGGVGLTLTRANHVLHLARWWNPAVEDQCTGRVLRIGQTRPVTVHIPIATLPGDRRSFDQNLHALLERKRALMRDALMPPAANDQDRDDLFSSTVGCA